MRRLFKFVQVALFIILAVLVLGIFQPSAKRLPTAHAFTFGSNPASGATIDIYSVQGVPATSNIILQSNAGGFPTSVTINTVTEVLHPTITRTTVLNNGDVIPDGGTLTVTYQCLPVAANVTTTGTLTLNYTDEVGPGVATYNINCHSIYNSTPPIGGAINAVDFTPNPFFDDDLGVATATLTITNSNLGAANPALVGTVAMQVGSAPQLTITAGTPFNIPAGGNQPVTVQCDPALGVAGTFNGVVDVTVTGPVSAIFSYAVTCTSVGTPDYSLIFNAVPVAPGGTIDLDGPNGVPVGQSFTVDPLITISNDAGANANLNVTISETSAEFAINGQAFGANTPVTINNIAPGTNQTIAVDCSPTATGNRTATLTVDHDDPQVTPDPATYTLQCTGIQGTYQTNPATSGTANNAATPHVITISTTTGVAGNASLVIQNGSGTQAANTSGNTDYTASMTITTDVTQITLTPNSLTNAPVTTAAPQTINIACTSATTGTFTENFTVTHTAPLTNPTGLGATVFYRVTCNVTTAGTPTYSASSGTTSPGSTVHGATTPVNLATISATTGTTGSLILTISNTGGGSLVINTINGAAPPPAGTPTAITSTPASSALTYTTGAGSFANIAGGESRTITISCTSASPISVTGTLTIAYTAAAAGTAVYNIACNVTTATAAGTTPTVTPTATGAPVSSSAIVQCPNNTVLSTPFPQNAAGEFLLVNCFTITGAGMVSISLTQILTNTAADVTEADKSTISANAGLLSVWRMGSWFLVPDGTYNAATQTFTFTSAAGTNIYAFFYGAITRPVGTQGTSIVAGTTTGDVEDEIGETEKNSHAAVIAAVISTIFVICVGIIFFARRQQNETLASEAG